MEELNPKRKKHLNKLAILTLNKIRDAEEILRIREKQQKIREKIILPRYEYAGKIYLCPVCECLVSQLLVKSNWVGCKKCWDLED